MDAKKEFNIDLSHSIFVGDQNSDIEAGLNAYVRNNFLIQTGIKIKKILKNLKELKSINF